MNIGPLHVRAQQRYYTDPIETLPLPSRGRRSFDYLMLGVSFVQPFALVPQILRIYVNHSTSGVSLSTWALFTGFNALWALYGIVHRDVPIATAYILIALFDAIIVLGVLVY